MKVLLVATNRERFPYPVAPLGALCVAAAAQTAGHTVDFLDMGLASSPQKALRRALKKDGYQAVGFGIRNLDNCWAFAPKLYFDEVRELAETVRLVLAEAIEAGGSTLRDFAAADGALGYFQHRFQAYGREDEPCLTPRCQGEITRTVQSGRSTFHCPVCQR